MKTFGFTEDRHGTQQHYAIHVKPGQSVTYSQSMLIRGTNRHSRKSYARWQLETRFGFRRTNNGTITAFAKAARHWTSPANAFGVIENNQQDPWTNHLADHQGQLKSLRHFTESVKTEFNITNFKDVYPIAGLKELRNYEYIPSTLLTDSRATDIMDFTRRAFGVKNYRKDLVRQVASTPMPVIAIAKEFKNLVPIDWIITFLANSNGQADTYARVAKLRDILRLIDPRSYRRMLFKEFSDRDMMMMENLSEVYRSSLLHMKQTGRGSIEIPHRSYASFQDLHDSLIGYRGTSMLRATPYENKIISLSTVAKKLHGTKTNGYVIACAMDTDDMKSWGTYMGNCIGSYIHDALNGRGTFGGVCVQDQLIANFQITSSGILQQLLGRFNERLEEGVRTDLEKVFVENGVKIPEYYLGGPAPVYPGNGGEGVHVNLPVVLEEHDPQWDDDPVVGGPFARMLAELNDEVDVEPHTRIQLGRGVYLAQGVDEDGVEVPF